MDKVKKDDLESFENEMLINYAKRVLKLPNCGTCSARIICEYAPQNNEPQRINCMFYTEDIVSAWVSTIRISYYVSKDLVDYAKRVLKLPDCNTCGRRKACKHAPGWGEWVRINCMFYEGE